MGTRKCYCQYQTTDFLRIQLIATNHQSHRLHLTTYGNVHHVFTFAGSHSLPFSMSSGYKARHFLRNREKNMNHKTEFLP